MNSSHLQGRALRGVAWLAATVLVLSYVLSALIYQPTIVRADDVSSRSIDMVSSQEDAETDYTVQFTVPAGTTMGAFRVEFCDNSPIPHDTTCDFTAVGDDIPQVDANAGNIVTLDGGNSSVTNATASNCDNLTLTAPSVGDNTLTVACDNADALGGLASTVTLAFNDVDNPDNSSDSPANPNNTFYARLYVYSVTTPPADADPQSTTNVVHTGGIAMSTAEQLTITARVQEVLEFCVGDTNTAAGAGDDCSNVSGNDINLGVLDFASVNDAETEDSNGYAMVRTNASSGVVVDYFANNGNGDDSEGDGFNDGHLAVSTEVCDFGPVTETDQCINSVGTTQAQITAGTEAFGMCVQSVDQTAGSGTGNLTRDLEYDGACTNADAANGYAFDGSGATDRIASSGSVVDDETLVLDWGGTAAITTPTGVYTTVLTFIATATF